MSVQTIDKKQFCCVDICKFICSLLVVSIHVPPTASYILNYDFIFYLSRLAVPFFFIASGFFLFRKMSYENPDYTVLWSFVKRILKLYLIWSVIYFPLAFYYEISKNPNGIVSGLIKYVRDFFFDGSYSHLWYLSAMIVATLILMFLLKHRMKLKYILGLAVILYIIGLLPQTYFGLLEPLREYETVWGILKAVESVIVTTRNGVFEGLLFMGIGMLFAFKPIRIKFKLSVVLFAFSFILFLAETVILQSLGWIREPDIYVFLVPTVFFLFYIVIHIELKQHKIYRYLREQSTLIFYLHLFVSSVLNLLLPIVGLEITNSLIQYSVVIVATVIVSHIIILLSRKFLWLKKVYS